MDGCEILHQLIDGLSHYYIIYRVSTIQGGAWFLPSKKNDFDEPEWEQGNIGVANRSNHAKSEEFLPQELRII